MAASTTGMSAVLPTDAPPDDAPRRDFIVVSQKLDLEIDFEQQSLIGSTQIRIRPLIKALRTIKLNCRQCSLSRMTVDGKNINTWSYQDPYKLSRLRLGAYTVNHHDALRSEVSSWLKSPPEEELSISLPKTVFIREDTSGLDGGQGGYFGRLQGRRTNTTAETPVTVAAVDPTVRFAELSIEINFELRQFRDVLHFVGLTNGDPRYPYAYTTNSPFPGTACSLFPCVDDPTSRCQWEISIKCPRTLDDAFKNMKSSRPSAGNEASTQEGMQIDVATENSEGALGLSEEESSLEIQVVCSGDLADEVVDPNDHTKKIVSFAIREPSFVSANQIGFAVGPFELVDLSEFREIDDDDKLGAQAIRINAYCLPGRADEVRNTCLPLAKAIDYFTTTFISFSSDTYKLCFVDDLSADVVDTAQLSICSNRLLFPEDVIEPLNDVTRKLVLALASQYAGINVAAKDPSDQWVIYGMASFMTDIFLKQLMGNNEYRYRQKLAAERVYDMDIDRPSMLTMGTILHIDPSEQEFLMLKAGVVFFILDRRLNKAGGTAGMSRIITRALRDVKEAEEPNATLISTSQFRKYCEKMGHLKLDEFFPQWVWGAGCPQFQVTQRFNKKKLVVEMQIKQLQGNREPSKADIDPKSFLREAMEELGEVYADSIQPCFKGPMTIRIHEADGTPYEHIVDIKSADMKFEIPYNTKYKRLKRGRKRKDQPGIAGAEVAEGQEDILLYCLGDVLQTTEEVADWKFSEWSREQEEAMSSESYEWIRMDADFEWICKMTFNMPAYMYTSQLQQDRDVVAQMEVRGPLEFRADANYRSLSST